MTKELVDSGLGSDAPQIVLELDPVDDRARGEMRHRDQPFPAHARRRGGDGAVVRARYEGDIDPGARRQGVGKRRMPGRGRRRDLDRVVRHEIANGSVGAVVRLPHRRGGLPRMGGKHERSFRTRDPTLETGR
jgi:hypothetical protein